MCRLVKKCIKQKLAKRTAQVYVTKLLGVSRVARIILLLKI